jgi:hypothetical protein
MLLMTATAAIYVVATALAGHAVPGSALVLLAISFFGSLTLFVLGIVGFYLANIYLEVRRRPLFLIEEETKGHG